MGRGTLEEVVCFTCKAPQIRPSSAVYKTNFCNQECRNKAPKQMKVPDITGQVFGRLTAIEQAGFRNKNKRLYLCKCECGNTTKVDQYSLRYGKTTSCGCYIKDLLKTSVKRQSNALKALASRWEQLEEIAQDKPLLRNLLDNLEKEFPTV